MTYTLVTGASGGIGQAVARLAAGEGQVPLCVGRSVERLQQALPDYRHFEADLTKEPQIRALFERLETEELVPQTLVHCVGSTLIAPLERVTFLQYAETMATNLSSAIGTCQQFISLLKRRRLPGSIVLFSSVVSRIGVSNHEIIAAAKAGLEGFALSAAASHAALGIRINVIAPGLTETSLTRPLLSSEAGRNAAIKQYPLAGLNSADDVAELACWLGSAKAARITGQVIAVDGGFSRIRPLVRA